MRLMGMEATLPKAAPTRPTPNTDRTVTLERAHKDV